MEMVRKLSRRPLFWPREDKDPAWLREPPRNAAEAETRELMAMVRKLSRRPLLWPRESP